MSRTRLRCFALLLAAFAAVPTFAVNQPLAAVEAVKVKAENDGAILEVISSKPIAPEIQTIENPLRLVIDLPGSTLSTPKRRIPFRNAQIKDVRLSQHQTKPAVTRIVIDLAAPVQCTWKASGATLNIRIKPDESANAKPPTVSTAVPATRPVAVPYAPGASGALVEAGSRVANGSSITAKDQTAVLRLTRGGEVRVCPGTTLSVATSTGGDDLMLGMNTGAIETHYHLDESSDSILTPDFRIVLPGPGEFNLAVKSDPSGDMCVSSLPGSNSSVVVAEVMGNGTYELKPDQQVLFRRGSMQSIERPLTVCGCPPAQQPVMRASTEPPSHVQPVQENSTLALSNSNEQSDPQSKIENATGTSALPGAPTVPKENTPQETAAQVSTPLVFNAKEFARRRVATSPELNAKVAALPLSTKPVNPLPALVVLPPDPKPEHKGFFGKIGGFFRKML